MDVKDFVAEKVDNKLGCLAIGNSSVMSTVKLSGLSSTSTFLSNDKSVSILNWKKMCAEVSVTCRFLSWIARSRVHLMPSCVKQESNFPSLRKSKYARV